MKVVYAFVCTLACYGVVAGAPPVAGGFMSGPDSAILVYWFHPGLHSYEQGFDGSAKELPFAPGDVAGTYVFAQRAEFPSASYVVAFLAKIYSGDLSEELPGDQFSPFVYHAYCDGGDSLPQEPPLKSGDNRLCGGQPCAQEWVENAIGVPNMVGESIWFGFEWADSTPAAPAIQTMAASEGRPAGKFGIKDGDHHDWSDLPYTPVFRNRFLSICAVDTVVESGWRRPINHDRSPDSFLIIWHVGQAKNALFKISGTDTLICRMPQAYTHPDSVEVRAYYGDELDASGPSFSFDPAQMAPLRASFVYDESRSLGSTFDLLIENTGSEILDLVLGYDDRQVTTESREIILIGSTPVSIPFQVTAPPQDTATFLVTVADNKHGYYPYLVSVPYPPGNQTDAEQSENMVSIPDVMSITIHPNPCRDRAAIAVTNAKGAVAFEIFNILGQKIAELSGESGAEATWEGCDERGQRQAAGIYFVRLAGSRSGLAKRLILLP